ncbi:MAG: DNA alkylation repair protein [Thermoplasmata archaeon]
MSSDCKEIVNTIKSMHNPKNVEGMARYGISTRNTYGISIPFLRKIAKEKGQNHKLAVELWNTGIHEARILAAYIDDPGNVTSKQMDNWVSDFDSWDVCDQVCSNLFDKTRFAYQKASKWITQDEEFIKRAGFALISALAVHDKRAKDEVFADFLQSIMDSSTDERNFVKKAVNWSLRQIGKRSVNLNKKAIGAALRIERLDSKTARWIATDALRELRSDAVQKRVKSK